MDFHSWLVSRKEEYVSFLQHLPQLWRKSPTRSPTRGRFSIAITCFSGLLVHLVVCLFIWCVFILGACCVLMGCLFVLV
ncbi:unnamed protein product [Linum tenue]|uniref:Uncharacterized protein n=1 Tax=Linum tenue TaxID=586396 RepID=A0AAV0R7C1_9ROSI|nr:unnamed protein product [Linum tenue]